MLKARRPGRAILRFFGVRRNTLIRHVFPVAGAVGLRFYLAKREQLEVKKVI